MAEKFENQDLVEVLETPEKSDSDAKQYRLIRIKKNGIRALLISNGDPNKQNEVPKENDGEPQINDSNEKLAAVSVAAYVGGYNDYTSGVFGMAHFLEHMLFLGTEKYPGEDYFENYIANYGGACNAKTTFDKTVYYFNIYQDYLDEGVDCFSQFFISPLMRKESMNRERDAVESEFQLGIENDFRRMECLLRNFGIPGHPSSSFLIGNSKTLKDNITDDELYEKIHEFRKKYYVGERMSVSIQSDLSLNELERMVVKYFSGVPKATKLEPLISEIPEFTYKNAFTSKFNEKMCYMECKSGNKMIILSWCLPPIIKHYRTSPEKVIEYVLGHDGPGSFDSFLKKNFLAEKFHFSLASSSSVMGFLNITIELTEHGSQNIAKILDGLFSYLLLVKENGADEKLLKDLKKKCQIEFKFRADEDAWSNVGTAAENILTCAHKDILTEANVFAEIDVEFLSSVFDAINERKFNLSYLIPDYKDFNKKDDVTGLEYAEVDFPEEYQKLWENRKLNDEFKLPSANPYLPSKFDIVYNESLKSTLKPYPEKIKENDIVEVWYRLDDKFLLPKACITLCFISPYFSGTSQNFTMKQIYVAIIKELMTEMIGPINEAGNDVYVSEQDTYITIAINGYSDTIREISKQICQKFVEFTGNFVGKEAFGVCKEKLKNELIKYLRDVHDYYPEVLNELLDYNKPTRIEKLKMIEKISFEDMKHFTSVWTQQAKLKILVQGNILQDDTIQISNEISDILNLQKIDEELIETRTFQIPAATHIYKTDSFMPSSKNSTTLIFYQIGQNTFKTRSILDLFNEIVEQPYFNSLRTQQQLSYSVETLIKNSNNILGFFFMVAHQDKFSTKFVSERIEEFIKNKIYDILTKMDDKTFENFKKVSIKNKLAPNDELLGEVGDNWKEIKSGEYIFDRKTKQAEAVQKITKEEFWEFYENNFRKTSSRKLMIQICGSGDASKEETGEEIGVSLIKDPAEFTNSLYLHPVFKAIH